MVVLRRTCKAIKDNGEPCRAPPLVDGEYCLMHDPEKQDEAADARRLGGQPRRRERVVQGAYDFEGLRSMDGLWRLLDIAVADTLGERGPAKPDDRLHRFPGRGPGRLATSKTGWRHSRKCSPGATTRAGEGRDGELAAILPWCRSRMTTAERRLDQLSKELTARERALILLRWWADAVKIDERLRKYTPPEQHDEFESIVKAVEDANSEVYQCCGIWIEWLILTDLELAWLESLLAHRRQIAELRKALKARGVQVREGGRSRKPGASRLDLTPLPPPGRGFRPTLKRLVGVELEEPPPVPENWDKAVERLAEAVKLAVTLRWQELVAAERAFDDLGEYLGQRFVHPEVAEQLDICRAKILELHEAVQRLAGPFPLPEPTERFLEPARNRIPWDDLKPSEAPGQQPWNPRDGLYPALKEEVEAAEQAWLATLAPRLDR